MLQVIHELAGGGSVRSIMPQEKVMSSMCLLAFYPGKATERHEHNRDLLLDVERPRQLPLAPTVSGACPCSSPVPDFLLVQLVNTRANVASSYQTSDTPH